jgi:hypothetical protein
VIWHVVDRVSAAGVVHTPLETHDMDWDPMDKRISATCRFRVSHIARKAQRSWNILLPMHATPPCSKVLLQAVVIHMPDLCHTKTLHFLCRVRFSSLVVAAIGLSSLEVVRTHE